VGYFWGKCGVFTPKIPHDRLFYSKFIYPTTWGKYPRGVFWGNQFTPGWGKQPQDFTPQIPHKIFWGNFTPRPFFSVYGTL